MNVDRVARAMTAGAPRGGFTDRVMAPIHGRPQPGFTARVMNGLDVGRGFSPGARPFSPGARFLLFPAALVLAAGVAVWRSARVELPEAPAAPRLAVAAPDLGPAGAPAQPADRADTPRVARASRAPHTEAAIALPDAPAPRIYMIAALEGPADISMKSIEPAACTIPALDAPAPLKVTDLPGAPGGSPQKEFKEQS